jgi:hypothetical protein
LAGGLRRDCAGLGGASASASASAAITASNHRLQFANSDVVVGSANAGSSRVGQIRLSVGEFDTTCQHHERGAWRSI